MIETLKKILLSIVTIAVVFAAGFFSGWVYKDKKVTENPVIAQGEIVSNTIIRDLSVVPQRQKDAELTCYLTADPSLGITHVKDDEYTMAAGLCERKWHRPVRIRPRAYHHVFQIGITQYFEDSQVGGMFGYTYLFDNFGAGGGFSTSGFGPKSVWVHAAYLR